MRLINKGPQPNYLSNWHRQNPVATWDDFGEAEEKARLKEALSMEQDRNCCYCQAKLADDFHIEHFRDRHNHPNLCFDYQNLLVSCNGTYGDTCGHKKGSRYFNGMVSPLDMDCESKFKYKSNGKLQETLATDANTIGTIEVLNLNEAELVDVRRNLFNQMLSMKNECSITIQLFVDDVSGRNGFDSFYNFIVENEFKLPN